MPWPPQADDETEGLFIVGGAEYPVSLRSLPTVVESYKTLNDIDLVKAGDIGQARAHHLQLHSSPLAVSSRLPAPQRGYAAGRAAARVSAVAQVLVVRPQGMAPPPLGEYADGVTPPARRARERLFRERPEVDPATVAKVEAALVRLLAGGAPEGVEITDYEARHAWPVRRALHRCCGHGRRATACMDAWLQEMWDEKEHKWVPAIHQKRKARAAPKAKKAGQAAAEPEASGPSCAGGLRGGCSIVGWCDAGRAARCRGCRRSTTTRWLREMTRWTTTTAAWTTTDRRPGSYGDALHSTYHSRICFTFYKVQH